MLVLLCAGLSLVMAWLRGAPPWRLAAVRLRWLALPVAAFGAELAVFGIGSPAFAAYALWVQLAACVLLLGFVGANLHYRALGLVAAGTLMNLVVIAANGGYMPVRPSDMARIGHPGIAAQLEAGSVYQKSRPLTERTPLPWLADVIYLPLPFGPGRMLSAGDVLVSLGTFLLIQELLVSGDRIPSRGRRAIPISPAVT